MGNLIWDSGAATGWQPASFLAPPCPSFNRYRALGLIAFKICRINGSRILSTKKTPPSKANPAEEKSSGSKTFDWAEFITGPSGQSYSKALGVFHGMTGSVRTSYELHTPSLFLYCPECEGDRHFDCEEESFYIDTKDKESIGGLFYVCRNCRKFRREYSLSITRISNVYADVKKFGEWPPHGEKLSRRVQNLLGNENWQLFLKGRSAENAGLGIGAFIYYRRVVDNLWTELLEKAIEVAKITKFPSESIQVLETALQTKQFSKAVDMIGDGIPDVLKIDGHNPIAVLYEALSVHIHEKDDAECLKLAESMRIVLGHLADKINEAKKNHTDVSRALGRLMKK